ncbi:hypothetical protein ABN330_02810, partial [Escherichia coli]|uniref:hypothetical protein n=1 Tax=Escherichia coli TaxID=562 RepID=UPI0032DBB31B
YKITLNQAIALSGVGLIRRTSVASGVDVGCGINALSDLQNHAKSGYCAVWRRPDKTHQRRIRHPHIAGWISPAIFNY